MTFSVKYSKTVSHNTMTTLQWTSLLLHKLLPSEATLVPQLACYKLPIQQSANFSLICSGDSLSIQPSTRYICYRNSLSLSGLSIIQADFPVYQIHHLNSICPLLSLYIEPMSLLRTYSSSFKVTSVFSKKNSSTCKT